MASRHQKWPHKSLANDYQLRHDCHQNPQGQRLSLMRNTLKIWTQLGLGTALVGGMLAGCGGEAGENGETGRAAGSKASTSATAGEGGEDGEGGEGGEGGIDPSRAASDPVAYGIALAVTEAHMIAARDAFAVGRKAEAAEMFAHPVSEVLVDMQPVFAARGVADFSDQLVSASGAVLDGESAAQIDKRYEAIIASLRAAAAKAPSGDADKGAVAGSIVADQIERAAAMYRQAAGGSDYEPYLDGYGFAQTAKTLFKASDADIKAAKPALHARIADALALLDTAYSGAERPATLAADQPALAGASSRVMLAAGISG
jgi:hypothetical protein